MNNTEIFEHCENSSKQQRPECNTYWDIGIIYFSCGRNMKSSQRPTEFEQDNCDVTSIPGYGIKKNSSRGAKHGPSERQRMYYQAKQMLKKARQKKHGNHPTILSRWYPQRIVQDFTVRHRVGKKKTQCCMTELPRRSISSSQHKQRAFKIRSIGFSR